MKIKNPFLGSRFFAVMTIALMVLALVPSKIVSAAPVTYNIQVDAGTPVATGVVTDDEVCDKNKLVFTTTLMSTAAQGCAFHVIKPENAGQQNILDVWFNTPYAVETTVTGTSLKIRLREKTGGGGGPETWTAGIMLMYVDAAGTMTNFNGPEATRLVQNSADVDHTIDLSGQSATVPVGSKLGIRIRAVSGTSANMEVYYGSAADVAGTGPSGTLIVQEVEKLNQTINVTTAAPSSAAYGSSFTVAATASSGQPVSYSASGSCSVVGATFTMTSGTGTCTVKYDQAGNGTYNPAPQVTNSVSAATRSITVTADAKSITVGDAEPALTYTFAPALIPSDAFTGALTREPGTVVGSYAILQGSLALNSNYTLTYVGANFVINPQETTAPTVSSMALVNPSPTNRANVGFTVTFSEGVTGVDALDFSLTKTGAVSGESISGVTGGPTVYTVSVNTGTGSGTLRLDLNASGTGIQDLVGNPIGGGYASGPAYNIQKSKTFYSWGPNDGWVLESAENSNAGGTMDNGFTTLRLGDDAARKQYRSILSFDASTLPDNAVITKVTLKVKRQGVTVGGDPISLLQGFMVDIKKGFIGNSLALQLTDWTTAASKSYGPFSPVLGSGWYTMDLTSAKAYVNKVAATNGGLTQIRLRFKLGDNNDAIANYLSIFSGNAGIASRPQLMIEYYVP
jgi:hypothetical protein